MLTTMTNFNMNTMSSYSHLLGSYSKITMLIPKFYEQWVDHMENYPNVIDEDLQFFVTSGNYRTRRLEQIGTAGSSGGVAFQADSTNGLQLCLKLYDGERDLGYLE